MRIHERSGQPGDLFWSATLISRKAKLNPTHMRWPELKGIQEPALCPSSVSHLQDHDCTQVSPRALT